METGLDLAWYAIQVRPRYETTVASALEQKGYEQFLPQYRVRRRWSDRIKELTLPLFPGYLFCRFDPRRRLPVLMTPGVVLIVGTGKIPVPVQDEEVAALQAIVQSALEAQPWPYVKVGQRVRIERGSLAGLEGQLVEVKKRWRLVVSVALLQRSVAVEVDASCVTPVIGSRRATGTPEVISLAYQAKSA